MQPVKIDLHIHSVLSPCGDLLMTPKNIIKKAVKKNIKIIAITDHNSAKNVKVTLELARDYPITVVPGIEVETKEEVHVLCLFKKLSPLLRLQDYIYSNLPDEENDEEIFGPQIITDQNDEFVKKEKKLLATASLIGFNQLVNRVQKLKGLVIPSHVDKEFGLIKNLGLIPEDLSLPVLEIFKKTQIKDYLQEFPFLQEYNLIKNSDSHYLDEIEAQIEIILANQDADNFGINELFAFLRNRKDLIFLC